MAFDTKAFIEDLKKNQGKLTDEQVKQIEAALGIEAVGKHLEGFGLRQAEFSRKMNELAEQKKQADAAVKAKEDAVIEDVKKLSNWKAEVETLYGTAQDALEKERLRSFQLGERITRLATQYGEDPKTWLGGEPPPEPKKKEGEPPALDKRYLTQEEWEKHRNEPRSSLIAAVELQELAEEHRELFGKRLKPAELLKAAAENKRTLREQWETQFEVPKKRSELEEKAIKERIEARVAEERTKILSEHKLPVQREADQGSPILAMREDLKLAGKDLTTQKSESAVDAAVLAYNTGKYRSPTAGKA
jgi:hypothetical protein